MAPGSCPWLILSVLLRSVLRLETIFLGRVDEVPFEAIGEWYFRDPYALGVGFDHYGDDALALAFLFRKRHYYTIVLKTFPVKLTLSDLEELLLRRLLGQEEEEYDDEEGEYDGGGEEEEESGGELRHGVHSEDVFVHGEL